MKSMIAVLAFVMLSQAQAQTSQPQVTNQGAAVVQQAPAQPAPAPKRVMVYDERTNELVDAQAVAQPAQAVAAPTPAGSPIYILNNQRFNGSVDNNSNSGVATKQAQTAVQEQPTTVVQDTPLKASAADAIRANRKESEATTEDGIVQALEKARLNDENRRRDKFNNALSSDERAAQQQQTVQQPAALPPQAPVQQPIAQPIYQQAQPVIVVVPQQQAQPAPVVVATPAPSQTTVVVEAPEQVQAEPRRQDRKHAVDQDSDLRSEIRAEKPEIAEEKPREYYVSALVGMGKYSDVINVKGNASGGVAVGKTWDERFVLEASFLYGSYQLTDLYWSGYTPRIVNMNQYNLALAAKYQLPIGRLVPYAGVVGAYTRRSYADDSSNYSYGNSGSSDSFRTSNAFDAGVDLGLDLKLTKMFSIGFDFRYMTNVFYRQSTNYPTSFYQNSSNEMEKLDYYTALVTGKLSF